MWNAVVISATVLFLAFWHLDCYLRLRQSDFASRDEIKRLREEGKLNDYPPSGDSI
jgi:hypothetical protein